MKKEKLFLFIDTTDGIYLELLRASGRKETPITIGVSRRLKKQSEDLPNKIDELLTKNNLAIKDLDAIAVAVGPGSYTGTRVGVVCANTISFVTGTPLVAVRKDKVACDKVTKYITKQFEKGKTQKIVKPYYLYPPKITKPKKRRW